MKEKFKRFYLFIWISLIGITISIILFPIFLLILLLEVVSNNVDKILNWLHVFRRNTYAKSEIVAYLCITINNYERKYPFKNKCKTKDEDDDL